ncbi:hypothetical protein [uncultured Alteromonas sp.]|mgnify:CR=1 FL=1|uniref:hypothetical protein n=1 Tax=uncultured Alteromonas sp. TaxID=179113 RepID=UPI0030EF9E9E|tara:strand:- start:302 stop:670 length:369 start_codon:yes stop_codon:yes gene_type:complete
MITQEFLSQCSEEQINKGVAWVESKEGVKAFSQRRDQLLKFTSLSVSYGLASNFNPCANPNDIMPIAFANGIAIMPDSDGSWKSGRLPSNPEMTFGWSNFVRGYKNPLRAICEVYILMSFNK